MALPLILRNFRKSQGLVLLNQGFQNTSPAVLSAPRALIGTLNRGNNNNNRLLPLLARQNVLVKSPQRLSHGDHSLLWTAEKGLSVALLGVIPAAFLFPSNLLDNLLAVAVVTHQHWGIEAIVIDYIRPILFGPLIPKISLILCYIISAATLGGLLYFNYNDVGITKAIQNFWAASKGNQKSAAPAAK